MSDGGDEQDSPRAVGPDGTDQNADPDERDRETRAEGEGRNVEPGETVPGGTGRSVEPGKRRRNVRPDGDGGRQTASAAGQGELSAGGQGTTEFAGRVDRAIRAIRESERRVDPGTLLEYTTDRRDLHRSVQFQWGLFAAVIAGVLTAMITGLIAALGGPVSLGLLVLVVLFGLGTAWVVLRYRAWVYQVREDSLYLERGVLVHRRTHVPYVRIQHVDTSRGPLERWLGLSTLVVYTAGSRGADVSVPGLEPDEARDLQQRVKRLATEAEGGDAV